MALIDDDKVLTISGTGKYSGEAFGGGGGLAGLWILGSSGASDPGNITIRGCPDHADIDHDDPTNDAEYADHGAVVAGPTSIAGAMKYVEMPSDRMHAINWFAVEVATAPGAGETLTIYPNFF